jgi:diguanylate cyclase (GGDEF)-like protein
MIRTLRHATELTDHREHERLDQSLLQSVTDLAAAGTQRAARRAQTPAAALQARLWRLSGPDVDSPLILSAPAGEDAGPLPAAPSISPQAESGIRQAIHTQSVVTAMQPSANGSLRCLTWLPVARRSTVMGVLEIDSPVPLSPARLNIVQGMCSLYANHLSLLHDSQVDTLTQLLNRKTFDDSIQRLLNHTRPHGPQTWVAVIDIDHFKRINDGFGHLFGDEVLLLVAGMLRRAFRHQDKVFRFGGEEFVALLQGLDEVGALTALQRLRQTIEDHPFPQVGRVTVSVGATAIQPGDAACDALGRADDALYHAKSHGRNQVCIFEHLQANGAIAPSATLHGDIDLF